GGAGFGQKAGESALQPQRAQIDALLQELSGRGLLRMALIRKRPRDRYCCGVHDRESVPADRITAVEGYETPSAIRARPPEDLQRGAGAANGEIAHQKNVAVCVRAVERVTAIRRHVRVFADHVLEEPEFRCAVAAVEAVSAGVQEQ